MVVVVVVAVVVDLLMMIPMMMMIVMMVIVGVAKIGVLIKNVPFVLVILDTTFDCVKYISNTVHSYFHSSFDGRLDSDTVWSYKEHRYYC